MNCLPYHQTVHPAGFRVHPFDVFDDMFNLTRRPSSCHGAYLDEQRAMETRRREPKTRQQQPARRAKLPTRERAEPFQVSVVEDSDDALVVSIRILGTYPKHSQLKIAPNGRTSLRVSMTAMRPVHQRVQDMWGRLRLVQTGVEKHTLFSETLNFKTDVPLLLKNVQARAISEDVVLVRMPYQREETAGVADEFEFQVVVNSDPEAEEEDQTEKEDDPSDEEVTAAIAADVDTASEGSFEIPIDGTVEDCELDE